MRKDFAVILFFPALGWLVGEAGRNKWKDVKWT
jgi:hypothetical protein